MRKKILIIEDEPFIILMVRMRLEANRFDVVTAADGMEGLQKAVSEKPDLILLDVLMPKLDGFHFVKEIRKRTDDTRLIPIIVLSARESMRELFDPKEISGFFSKPFDSIDLLEKINSVLKISEKERGTAPKALVIGLEWDALRPIKQVLEKNGFIVYVCRDAHEAVQEAVKIMPHVVFAPSLLSGMDIWELRALFRDLPLTKNTPFVVYDLGNVGETGSQTVKATKVIDYRSHEELASKTEDFLKEYF